jgi:CRISPR system Cascade subunit CasE
LAWLGRRASAGGFSFEEGAVRVSEVAPASGRGAKAVTVAGALFEGVLTIVDAALFRAALEGGIGPAKAYGFGLLSIAPVR